MRRPKARPQAETAFLPLILLMFEVIAEGIATRVHEFG
jgi:hypothetical protein